MKISVFYDTEVFDAESVLGLEAIATGKDTLDGLFLLVEMVDDGFGVILCRSSEDIDLIVLAHFLHKR